MDGQGPPPPPAATAPPPPGGLAQSDAEIVAQAHAMAPQIDRSLLEFYAGRKWLAIPALRPNPSLKRSFLIF